MTASPDVAANLSVPRHNGWSRLALVAAVVAVPSLLVVKYGLHEAVQATVNGFVSGSYYSIGAVGLTLLYGVLRLMNFAWGDYMTLGAYLTLPVSAVGAPFVIAAAAAMVGTGIAALILELIVWGPLRRRGGKTLQTILAGIGVAFIIRYMIQIIASPELRSLGVNVTSSFEFLGLRIGRTQLLVFFIGYGVLAGLALALKYTWTGKQLRALSDSRDLAGATGLDTARLTFITQFAAGVLAGLAGVLLGAVLGGITPQLGFTVLLYIFAAVIMGGVGSVFGALAAGLILGLVGEWSKIVFGPQWQLTVGFVALIIVMLIRPEGIFQIRASIR